MSKAREIHCYDYVNHPYEQVREVNQFDLLPTAGFEIRF